MDRMETDAGKCDRGGSARRWAVCLRIPLGAPATPSKTSCKIQASLEDRTAAALQSLFHFLDPPLTMTSRMKAALFGQETWPDEAEEKYERIEVLGKGSFGMVWMARRVTAAENKDDDEFVAVKNILIKDVRVLES